MTAVPTGGAPPEPGLAGPDRQRVLGELIGMLAEVTGEDQRWAARVTAASRLEGDLRLESVELAALGELLRRGYGDRVDLAAFVADLDIYQIVGLTVGDLVAYVCACPGAGPGGSSAANPAGMPA